MPCPNEVCGSSSICRRRPVDIFVGVLEIARAARRPARSIPLLYGASGTFPAAVTAGTEAYAARQECEVVFKAPYPASLDAMAALVAEVAAHQPDVILGVGTTEADLRFARQLRRQRVRTLLIGLVAAPIQLFMHTLGTDADGFFGPSQLAPTVPNFSRLEYVWGEVPWRAALTTPPEPIADVCLRVPQAPDLGASLNPDLLREHGFDPEEP